MLNLYVFLFACSRARSLSLNLRLPLLCVPFVDWNMDIFGPLPRLRSRTWLASFPFFNVVCLFDERAKK